MGISYFQNATDLTTFQAGQTIFKDSELGDLMYVVVEGQVEILVQGKRIETVEKNGIVGEMSLLEEGTTRSATAIAITDCKLKAIDQKYFFYLVQQTPYFAIQVMQVMADRLRRSNNA